MTIHCVVGGQFGSEAKGHVAAQLARRLWRGKNLPTMLVRVGGSNAGHSAVDSTGKTWALRQIPVAAVIDPNAPLILAQGSEIDPNVLFSEIDALDAAGFKVSNRLYIDKYATVIERRHIEQEVNSDINARLGSTAKGIGAARADRIMRKATIWRDADQLRAYCRDIYGRVFDSDTALAIANTHNNGGHVIIEGTQGYGLGMHTDHYPQCTSGDCRTVDLLAQVGFVPLNPRGARDIHTWLVLRTFPIRVAGNSGRMENETTWEQLGEETEGYIKPELTTVTKKVRRVGRWDAQEINKAIDANGGVGLHLNPCLMFIDYLDPTIKGRTEISTLRGFGHERLRNKIAALEASIGTRFVMFGTSASTVICNDDVLFQRVNNWTAISNHDKERA